MKHSESELLRVGLQRQLSSKLPFPYLFKIRFDICRHLMCLDVSLTLTDSVRYWAKDTFPIESTLSPASDIDYMRRTLSEKAANIEQSFKAYRKSRLWC